VVTRNEALAQLTGPGMLYEMEEVEAYGKRFRAYKNAPPTLRDLYNQNRSTKPFLIYEDEVLTFEEAWRKSATLATALVGDYGVAKGDRVAISMRNYPEWFLTFVAATSVGAIAVAMNALWQPADMIFGLTDCGAKVLVCDQERLDRMMAGGGAPAGLSVIAARTTKPLPEGVRAFGDVLDRPETDTMPGVAITPGDDAIMLYTSGSTGHPKGAVSSHRAVLATLFSWEVDLKVNILRGLSAAPNPDGPQSGVLLGIPLFHVTGLHSVYLQSYRMQRRVVSMYKWDAAKAAELIEGLKLTHFVGPSAVTGDLVEYARSTGKTFPTLVYVGGGGAPRPPEQVRAIAEVFAIAKPGTGWGMTELNALGAGCAGEDYLLNPASSGRCHQILDLRIVGEDGSELGPMERGELQARGGAVMRGYWNNPKANAESFDGDWFRTGDVAYIDHDGFVFIVDRIKDLVIRGGENIGCGAVEAALVEHPDVIESCVFGVPDDRLGEEVGAMLYVRPGFSEDDLRAFLAARIARYEIPRYIWTQQEPLPRGATGKILKRELRKEAADRLKQPA
jgi:long-chain acyl-CoA synthetase